MSVSRHELSTLAAVRTALAARFIAIRQFHHKHPSPKRWGDSDRRLITELRSAIATLREREKYLERRTQ